jgi:arabinofuranan 3-O-arabinosyltransferase
MIESPQRPAAGPGWWHGQPDARSAAVRGSVDERLRRGVWLAACCLLLASIAFLTRPGNIIADTKIDMALDPASFLSRSLQLWDPAQFGSIQNQAVGYLFPMGPFYVLGKLMALPAWEVQRLWLTAIFVAAFLGTVRLSARLGLGTGGTQIAAGMAYALAPLALAIMGINSSEFAPAAFVPWVLLPLVRLMRQGQELGGWGKLRAAAQSAVAVALCGGINAASVAAVLLLAAIYILTGERCWPRWRVFGWWIPAVVAATVWWTVPLLIEGKYGVSFLPYTESAQVTTSVTSLADALRGTENWTSYLVVNGMAWWPVGYQIANSAIPTVLTGLAAALGLGGLVSRRLPERRFLLWTLLAGLLIVGSGYVSSLGNPLGGQIVHWINGPLGPLRNLWKFDPLIRLPLALGLGHWLTSWRFPRMRRAASAVVALTLAFLAIPAAVNGLSASGDFPAIPGYWTAATNWLNVHADQQAVLAVPGARFGEYVWGRPMDDVLEAMFAGDWASPQLNEIGSIATTRLLNAIEQQVEAGQGSAGLTQLLGRMGVKYVIVRDDLIRSDLYGAWPARVNDALHDSPGVVKVAQFGADVGSTSPDDAVSTFDSPYPAVEIFRVGGAQPIASVVPTAGTTRVYGGAESLLTLADLGVLKGKPVLLNSDSPGLPASNYVITDSLRRIVRNFGEIRIDYSQTLTAREPAQTYDAVGDFLMPGWDKYLAVARYYGIAGVTASSSGAGISAWPGQSATGLMPYSAIDGNLRTMWESASTSGPVGQWIQVSFQHPVDLSAIRVAFADQQSVGPPVTAVQVQTAAGQLTESVSQVGGYQSLPVHPGMTRWLRIKIAAVASGAYSGPFAQVGISEIAIPGISPGRAIVAPSVDLPAGAAPTVLLAKAEPQPTGCMLTSLRWVCSPSLIKPTEEQYGFDQQFTVPEEQASTLSGLAVMTSLRAISKAVYAGKDQPRVTASSTYVYDPQDMASAAFDGNPATAWVSGASDTHPVLSISWRGMRRLRQITVQRPPGASSLLSVLVSGSKGSVRGGVIGPSGVLTFTPPLRTDRLTLDFTPSVLPVQISDVQIPGVRPLSAPASRTVSFSCGHGPANQVNGRPVPTRATGSYADLLTGQPIPYTACSDAAIKAGPNSVLEPAIDPNGFDVQSALIDPAGPGGLAAASEAVSSAAVVRSWTQARRTVVVSAPQQSYLVVDQNFNAGWQASIAGRVLRPIQLDGWKQAWLLPAGTDGTVTMTFLPDAPYRLSIFAGLALLAALIVFAVVPLRRRRRRKDPAAGPGPDEVETLPIPAVTEGPAAAGRLRRLARWLRVVALAAAGMILVGVAGLWLGGYAGLLLVPVATLLFLGSVRLRGKSRACRALASWWAVSVLMLVVAIGQAAALVMAARGDDGGLVSTLSDAGPQLACLLIVARLAAELVHSYWTPARSSAEDGIGR